MAGGYGTDHRTRLVGLSNDPHLVPQAPAPPTSSLGDDFHHAIHPHTSTAALRSSLRQQEAQTQTALGGGIRFKAYPIGYFHLDIAEVSTAQGKLRLLVAIDRTSKFAVARLVESAGKMEAAQFQRDLAKAVPFRIHTVLTDNAVQFTNRARDIYDSQYIFDRVCDEHGIEHRLTKVNHPWTNGQVERMNRTLEEATVKRYHYERHDELRTHLQLFLDAYNHARRLKALHGLTPYEFTCRAWTQEPERFRIDPSHPGTEHLIPGKLLEASDESVWKAPALWRVKIKIYFVHRVHITVLIAFNVLDISAQWIT